MEAILEELRNERPELTLEQTKVVFTLLLDRVYNQKEAQMQDMVCNFFADEIAMLISRDTVFTREDLDLICFIFTDNN